MSSSVPDFSSTFDLVDDKLADAEKRLAEKRQAAAKARVKIAGPVNPEPQASPVEPEAFEVTEISSQRVIQRDRPKLPKKPKVDQERPELQLVSKEHRRNLTLKVLENNEVRFNELFHKLQLKGDSRKKQDLADEALELLFENYKSILQ